MTERVAHKILEGLKDAIAGHFTSVQIEGQYWVRYPGWEPIETAPEDQYVLVAHDGLVSEARFHDDDKNWWLANTNPYDYGTRAIYPTHWMPMPKPPR